MEDKKPVRRLSQMWNHENDVSKEDARKLCANYLSGSWETLNDDTFDMHVAPAGLLNRIFICENKSDNESSPDEPKKVILRFYGGKLDFGEGHIFRNGGIMEEVLVFYTMSNLGLGPKLYGVFPEGRLEQYIPCRMYDNNDYDSPEMEALFARKLARMHVCEIPLSKNCKTLSDKITDRMALYLSESKPKMLSKAKSDKVKQILANLDEEAELNWLKSIFPRIKTRQVLCHGDLNRANILIADEYDEPDDKLILIDYEFTSYNFRGLDITSHFSHRTVDVKNFKEAFKSGQDYPTLEERKHFIRAYNDEIRGLGAYELDEAENGLDNVDEMLMESLFFNLLFSIFSRFLMASDTDKFEAMGFDIFARVEEQEERYSNFKNELSDWLKSKK